MLLAALLFATVAAEPLRMLWTTDPEWAIQAEFLSCTFPTTFGPDGPWHGVVAAFGNFSTDARDDFGAVYQPFYPAGCGDSQLLSSSAGGKYNTSGSLTVTNTSRGIQFPDDWLASQLLNITTNAQEVFDLAKLIDIDSQQATANATLMVSEAWEIPLPNRSSYTNQIGVLGLGKPSAAIINGDTISPGPSILEQFKASSLTASTSFSVQMGSPSFNMSGSLVLGGYDQSRVLGPAGKFWYTENNPLALLLDINIGVAEGSSPFPDNVGKGLYRGNGNLPESRALLNALGGPSDAAVVIPNPAYPYISLPPGSCEAIASFLPVTFNSDIGFWLWDQSNSSFAKIVNSPAFLEFILADQTTTNYSIKVPFGLLNLTLESPILDPPAPYFPCQTTPPGTGFWSLGRAFLQAAFLAVNYDQNITWLGQAPGPSPDQSVFIDINPTDDNLTTNAIDSFVSSWHSHWQPIGDTTNNYSQQVVNMPTSSRPSGGTIAGIVIGVLIGVALFVAAAFYLLLRRSGAGLKRSFAFLGLKPAHTDDAAAMNPMLGRPGSVTEISGDNMIKPELDETHFTELGDDSSQEAGMGLLHEVEDNPPRFELGPGRSW